MNSWIGPREYLLHYTSEPSGVSTSEISPVCIPNMQVVLNTWIEPQEYPLANQRERHVEFSLFFFRLTVP